MAKSELKNIFMQGAIGPEFIAQVIAEHQHKTHIGAHDIFMGQVRADLIDDKEVVAIEYSAYEAMANNKFHEISKAALDQFDLSSLHIYHSIGKVKTGEICLFVIASSPHRKVVFEALQYVVEEIKSKVPVFGKELFEDDSFEWKVNS